jgi:hypothetical protein
LILAFQTRNIAYGTSPTETFKKQRPFIFVQTFNAFLPPGEQTVEGRSTARLHLRIPALKLTMKDVQVWKTISAQKRSYIDV